MKKLAAYIAAIAALLVCFGVLWQSYTQSRTDLQFSASFAEASRNKAGLNHPKAEAGGLLGANAFAWTSSSTRSGSQAHNQNSSSFAAGARPAEASNDRLAAANDYTPDSDPSSAGILNPSESLPTQWIATAVQPPGSPSEKQEPGSNHVVSDDPTEANELTEKLSMQPFDSFYAVLFDPKVDLSSLANGSAQVSQTSSFSAATAGGPEGNPFAEAIISLRRDPLPGAPVATAGSAVASGQSASQNSGAQSSSKTDTPSSPPTQSIMPSNQTPVPRTPLPQISLPGGAKPFTVVGDLYESGIGGVFPALRIQSDQFEIPRVGMVNLKLSVVPDPAYSLSTVLVDDLNGDDLPDIALARETEPAIMVWLGLPNGDMIYAGASPIPFGGRSLAVGDFNGDNRPDMAVLRGVDTKSVDILYGLGDGRFAYASTAQFTGDSDMLVANDLDDNGRLDLFGTSFATYKSWVLLGGWSPLEFLKTTFSFTNLPTAQVLQDLNLDSRLDQLFLFQNRTKLSVVLNPPRSMVIRHVATVNLRYPMILVLGDILGEGFTDIGVARLKR
jgi:hypothetical protein